MTRNSDIDCKDIFGCTHELEIPISEGGDILYWRCRCGAKQEKARSPVETEDSRKREEA